MKNGTDIQGGGRKPQKTDIQGGGRIAKLLALVVTFTVPAMIVGAVIIHYVTDIQGG